MRPHTYEPELAQPTPRRLAAREGCGHGCVLWLGRVLLLPHTTVGLYAIYKAVTLTLLDLAVLTSGTVVPGHVTGKHTSPGKGGRVYYTVEFAYVVDGAAYAGSTTPDADEYAAVAVAQPIEVRVYPPYPAEARWPGLPGHDPGREALGMIVAALFWNAIVFLCWWWVALRPYRQRRLIRWGRPTTAVVREVKSGAGKGGPWYQLRYDYAVEPGGDVSRWRSRKLTLDYPKSAADVQAGDVLTVLYDPRRPRRHLVYRFADYQAVPP